MTLNMKDVEKLLRFLPGATYQSNRSLLRGAICAMLYALSCAFAHAPKEATNSWAAAESLGTSDDIRLRLGLAEKKWKDAAIQNYSYQMERECLLCQSPVTIKVKDGKCVDVRAVGVPALTTCVGATISERLDSIREWVLDRSGSSIRASFDAKLGYPKDCFIRANIDGETAHYRISKFIIEKLPRPEQ